jgi:hypothetical protein
MYGKRMTSSQYSSYVNSCTLDIVEDPTVFCTVNESVLRSTLDIVERLELAGHVSPKKQETLRELV